MGPSFLIPNGVVGCFGSVTPFRSMVPKRSDLFDVSVGGPAAGAAVAAGLFLAGLAFSAGGQVRGLVAWALLGFRVQDPSMAFLCTCSWLP